MTKINVTPTRKFAQVITAAKAGGDCTSIQSAVDAIAGTTRLLAVMYDEYGSGQNALGAS